MQLLRASMSNASPNNRRIVIPGNGNVYQQDGKGYILAQQSDVGYLLSQGFSPPDNIVTDLFVSTGVIASGTSSVQFGMLPPNYYIEDLIFAEVAGAAITGGINVGSTPGGNDVVSALAVSANALIVAVDTAKLKRAFSTSVATPLYVSAVTSWNGANLSVKAVLGVF